MSLLKDVSGEVEFPSSFVSLIEFKSKWLPSLILTRSAVRPQMQRPNLGIPPLKDTHLRTRPGNSIQGLRPTYIISSHAPFLSFTPTHGSHRSRSVFTLTKVNKHMSDMKAKELCYNAFLGRSCFDQRCGVQ